MTRLVVTLLAVVLSACASAQPGGSRPTGSSPAPEVRSPAAALGSHETELEAGTYRIDLTGLAGGPVYPTFEITVPEGWVSLDGWSLTPATDGQDVPSVALTFWNVDEVYGHPCQWAGTELRPGPDVDGLAETLAKVPMRDATEPRPVTVDGRDGMYLEWTVPDDIEVDENGDFPECDETADGHRDFRSWTGLGWAEARFQQGPGQLDRLWILDVDGQRLIVDAFSMPSATEADIDELIGVVESIRFLDG
jgi:hypothetical protein